MHGGINGMLIIFMPYPAKKIRHYVRNFDNLTFKLLFCHWAQKNCKTNWHAPGSGEENVRPSFFSTPFDAVVKLHVDSEREAIFGGQTHPERFARVASCVKF
jgi:hypothetical protein